MILPATVPVDTHLPIPIVPSQPVATESQPEPVVVTPIEVCTEHCTTWYTM